MRVIEAAIGNISWTVLSYSSDKFCRKAESFTPWFAWPALNTYSRPSIGPASCLEVVPWVHFSWQSWAVIGLLVPLPGGAKTWDMGGTSKWFEKKFVLKVESCWERGARNHFTNLSKALAWFSLVWPESPWVARLPQQGPMGDECPVVGPIRSLERRLGGGCVEAKPHCTWASRGGCSGWSSTLGWGCIRAQFVRDQRPVQTGTGRRWGGEEVAVMDLKDGLLDNHSPKSMPDNTW